MSDIKKMSQFAILPLLEMSKIQKLSQFGQRGGGQHFSKMSEIQKCPKGRRGGVGSTLIGTLSQIFSIFYFDASPNINQYSMYIRVEGWGGAI